MRSGPQARELPRRDHGICDALELGSMGWGQSWGNAAGKTHNFEDSGNPKGRRGQSRTQWDVVAKPGAMLGAKLITLRVRDLEKIL